MTTRIATSLRILSWQEEPVEQLAEGGSLSRAAVELGDGADGLTGGTMLSVLYYRADGTSRFVSVLRLNATLAGRPGSVVATGEGSYDGTTAVLEATLVAGSGTGSLTGAAGTVTSSSTQADYPHMPITLDYDLDAGT